MATRPWSIYIPQKLCSRRLCLIVFLKQLKRSDFTMIQLKKSPIITINKTTYTHQHHVIIMNQIIYMVVFIQVYIPVSFLKFLNFIWLFICKKVPYRSGINHIIFIPCFPHLFGRLNVNGEILFGSSLTVGYYHCSLNTRHDIPLSIIIWPTMNIRFRLVFVCGI